MNGIDHRHPLQTTTYLNYDRMDLSVAIYPCVEPWLVWLRAGTAGYASDTVILIDHDI